MFGEDIANNLALCSLIFFLCGDVQVKRDKQVFQPQPARADVIVGRHAVELNVAAFFEQVLMIGIESFRDSSIAFDASRRRRIEAAQLVQWTSTNSVCCDNFIG